jgi:hypothetical protein
MIMNMERKLRTFIGCVVVLVLVLTTGAGVTSAQEPEYTSEFNLEMCRFSTIGFNPYFILIPGYRLVLEGEEEGEEIRVEETVLAETEPIFIEGLGRINTRVVLAVEWIDGELAEVTRDFYAICTRTNSVFYFGEDVDNYEDGEIVDHEGAWRAGVDGAMPGIIMPGTFLLGARYYQEIAPDVALDRAENTAMGVTIEVPAGVMVDCVEVLETTPLEPDDESIKVYCPGIGLVKDEEAELVEFGFVPLGDEADGFIGARQSRISRLRSR